jgi:glycosyltransferase involved in cell wall biosynthesis
MPKVSVVSAAYNHEAFVEEAIQSVLNQTFEDFELVITDDHSTDSTVEKIKKFDDPRVKLLCNEANEGCSPTYNRSFENSTGEYIAWLDTDDVYEPHLLSTLVDYLDHNPKTLGVFGLAEIIDGQGNSIDKWSSIGVTANRFELLRLLFQRHRPFCNQAGLVRRSIIEELGHMAPEFGQSHDSSLWMRIMFQGDLVVIPEYVLRYRRHGNNRTGVPTAANLNRGAFENFELLNIFTDHVSTTDTLLQIFPEVKNSQWPVNDKLVQFHLAHLAIGCNSANNQLFGLHLLHQLMKQPDMASYLKEECGFTYNHFFKLEETLNLFANGAISLEVGRLSTELDVARETVQNLNQELSAAHRRIEELTARKSDVEESRLKLEAEIRAMRNSRVWKTANGMRRLLTPWQ